MSSIAEREATVKRRVGIRLALPSDFPTLLCFSGIVHEKSGRQSFPRYAQERYLKSLLPTIVRGRLVPSPEGFVVVAERDAGEAIGCLSCEYQRYELTGEYVAYLSTFYCVRGAPLKTAHRMLAFAGKLIWEMGVDRLVISVESLWRHRAYQALGARPVTTLCEGDLSEMMARLKERGV